MSSFLKSAVQMYYELTGPKGKPLKKVETPYIPDKDLFEGSKDFADPQKTDKTQAAPAAKAGGPSNTDKNAKAEKLATYVRIDKTAKAFRTTNKKGPRWSQVVRRVKGDMDTRQVIQDLQKAEITKAQEHAKLPPGVRNI
eukprot:5591911-Amphidinium_carterae.1